MANIKLNDLLNLNLSGADLFNDSESFLTELRDENEQMEIIGGQQPYRIYCVPPTCVQTRATSPRPTVVIVYDIAE